MLLLFDEEWRRAVVSAARGKEDRCSVCGWGRRKVKLEGAVVLLSSIGCLACDMKKQSQYNGTGTLESLSLLWVLDCVTMDQ